MLITTTPGIEGRTVTQYLGVVTAQGVLGVNVFKDVGAGVRKPPVRSRPGRITLAVVLLVLAAWIVLVQP